MDATLYCCALLLTIIALFTHDVLTATPASLIPKPALFPSLACVTAFLPPAHIPILRSPIPGYFLTLIKYTSFGTTHNDLEKLHRYAHEIERRARCSFGMSVQTELCHHDECPYLHYLQTPGCHGLVDKYEYYTSISPITHFSLPFLKVNAMLAAFVSKDVYELYNMVELVAEHLGIPALQLTRNLSMDAFCLIQRKTDLQSNTDRNMVARGTLNGLPFELQAYIYDNLNDTSRFRFDEITKSLVPRPVPLSLYQDSPGAVRLSQIESNLQRLHAVVSHFDSSFVAPVYTDPSVAFTNLTNALEAAVANFEDHEAQSNLINFDLEESKISLQELEVTILDLNTQMADKSDVVRDTSALLTVQTRSSAGADQDALTAQLQAANEELTIATAAVADCIALIKKTKEDIVGYKAQRRTNLVGVPSLRRIVQTAKSNLSTHQGQQGKSSVHVPLKDRGCLLYTSPSPRDS